MRDHKLKIEPAVHGHVHQRSSGSISGSSTSSVNRMVSSPTTPINQNSAASGQVNSPGDENNQTMNMLPTDLASSLQTHSLFSTASMEFIIEIAKKMHVRPFKRGDVIIKEGDVGKAMFFILRGSVSIFSGSDNDIVVGDMHSGSFFGEISMFFNIPRTATIVAKTRCLLAVLIGDELHKVLENYPAIAEHIRTEAETRMQFVKARMEAQGRKTAQNGVVESEAFSSRTIEQKLSDNSILLDIKPNTNIIKVLASMTEIIKFSEKEIILQSVEKTDCVYMVFTGSLEVSSAKKASANADIHVIKVPPGSWFDHKSLASYRAANYIVTSVTACELGTVKISSLEAVKDQDEGMKALLTRIKGGTDTSSQGSTMSSSSSSTDAFPALTSSISHSNSMQKLPSITTENVGLAMDSAISPQSNISQASSPLAKTHMTLATLPSAKSTSQTNLSEGLGASLLQGGTSNTSNNNLSINEIKAAAPNRRRASVAVWADPRLMQLSQQKLSLVSSPQGSLSNLGGSSSTLPTRLSNKSDFDSPKPYHTIQNAPDTDAIRKAREEKAIYHILKFLDIQTIFRVRRVCKSWFKAARDRRLCQTLDLSPYNKKITNDVLGYIFNFYGMDVVHLVLRQCWQVTDKGLAVIGDRARNIQTLDLHSCWDLTQTGISSLCSNIGNLKNIDLSNCRKVDDTCIHNILSNHRSLESLSFSYCKLLSNNTMLFISQFCPRLRKLNLQRCTGIGDSGFQHWSRVQFKHLHELNLSDCSFLTDMAVALICQSCTYLTNLNLSFCCSLTESSLVQISNSLAWLESLDVSFCGGAISDNALLVLARALPSQLSPHNILSTFALELQQHEKTSPLLQISQSSNNSPSLSSVATTMNSQNTPNRCVLKRLSVRGCVRITMHGIEEFLERATSLELLNASNCPNVNLKALQNYLNAKDMPIGLLENGSLDSSNNNNIYMAHNRRSTC